MARRTQAKNGTKVSLSVAVIVALVALIGYMTTESDNPFASSQTAPLVGDQRYELTADEVATAENELAALTVAPKGSMDDYDREGDFGTAWTDDAQVALGGNGCDTRNDILDRDLENAVVEDDCTVVSGRLWNPFGVEDNPYDHWIDFERGQGTSMAVQIDHLVAAGNAWVSGGDRLSQQERIAFANDPINLVAVDGPTNGAKGDSDAADWLPPNDSIHCFYAASQVQVKNKYRLSVTQDEHDVLAQLISECPAGV